MPLPATRVRAERLVLRVNLSIRPFVSHSGQNVDSREQNVGGFPCEDFCLAW